MGELSNLFPLSQFLKIGLFFLFYIVSFCLAIVSVMAPLPRFSLHRRA